MNKYICITAQVDALVKSTILIVGFSNSGILFFKQYIFRLCRNKFRFIGTETICFIPNSFWLASTATQLNSLTIKVTWWVARLISTTPVCLSMILMLCALIGDGIKLDFFQFSVVVCRFGSKLSLTFEQTMLESLATKMCHSP